MTETKRDIYKRLVDEEAKSNVFLNNLSYGMNFYEKELQEMAKKLRLDEYDTALPDDLPVIPKEVGEWLKNCKHDECDLVDAIVSSVNSIITSRRVTCWMEDHFDTFARAWLLGVWRVEETGEVVKL
ncbi:phage protein [Lacticaseibacillus paracasei]|nr:phage protein [Lacticaseibacillus paracasei]